MVIDADTLPKRPTRKSGPKKKTTTRKPKPKQQPLPAMEDEFKVPKPIQNVADAYNSAMTAKGEAGEKFKAAKATLILKMQENGISSVRVLHDDGNYRVFSLENEVKVKCKNKKKKDRLEE